MTTFNIPDDLEQRGRVQVVCDAIKKIKQEIGNEVAVGTYVLGPFTLAGQLMDLNDLFKLAFKKTDLVNEMLDRLADVIIRIAKAYQKAGADYVCVREMGATTDILSPRSFRKVILPHLQKIHKELNGFPNILHICGSTNSIIDIMCEADADAISVEAKNDLIKTRKDIGDEPLVFGNIESFDLFVNGTPEAVREAVIQSLDAGVDALWPSCDIWPDAKIENLKVMVETVKELGAGKWRRKW